MELKEPLLFREQLDKLINHGVDVDDEKEAEEILKQINYYRLTGYALQFRQCPTDSNYVEGTQFKTIYRLYQLDERLRNLFREYIEKVEVYYKTQIAYGFSIAKCMTHPHDQHYDEMNFFNKKGYREVMDSFNKEKLYYRDSLIVKHHKNKYASKMPLWVIVELMSFPICLNYTVLCIFQRKTLLHSLLELGKKHWKTIYTVSRYCEINAHMRLECIIQSFIRQPNSQGVF